MSRYITNKNRVCHICENSENREATPYELQFKIAFKWMKVYENKRWTGKYICSRCYSRNYERKRREIMKNIYDNCDSQKHL